MRRLYLLLFMIPLYLFSEWDQFFSSDEDPTIFHHVNVMSGQLNLAVQDSVLQGAHPFALSRTYSSGGVFERNRFRTDLISKGLRGGGLFVQGGWSFLPHANLEVISPGVQVDFKKMNFRLPEPSGAVLSYFYERREKGKHHTYYYYKPERKIGACTGVLSSRTDPQNNLLRVDVEHDHPDRFLVKAFLANGGQRDYQKLSKPSKAPLNRYYYKLMWESLPSGRHIKYQYEKDVLSEIKIKNPEGKKTLSWIRFELVRKSPYQFRADTSDNRSILYTAVEHDSRDYLREVLNNSKKKETYYYSKGAKGMGSHVSEIFFEDSLEAKVKYYDSDKPLNLRDESFYKKNFSADRVKTLEAPVGKDGELKTIAEFTYQKNLTEVKDAEGAFTRYHYEEDKILKIERLSPNRERISLLEFIWKDKRLLAKLLRDELEKPIFSKTFEYDKRGNVLKETLWGNLTGFANEECFSLNGDSDGTLLGAESCFKTYEYDPSSHLLISEHEEEGLSYSYSYKPSTDLVTRKLTSDHGRVLKREFFVYDADHFLAQEIVDDGIGQEINDLSSVTQRTLKIYETDPEKGLITSVTESYLDLASQSIRPLKRHVYAYNSNNLPIRESIYDENGDFRYELKTEYDDRGHVIYKTDPLGRENTYRYSQNDCLEEVQEVGLPRRVYHYDSMGRPVSFEEFDSRGSSKRSYSFYDVKSRVVSQIDFLGHETTQRYDALGRCVYTRFPQVKDSDKKPYFPELFFTYDASGNITSFTNSKGEKTETSYNFFQKPTLITRADGTKIRHIYHKNGTLAKTIEPDHTETRYSYDPFLRVTSKKIYGSDSQLLSSESWSYSAFEVLSHTDEKGLKTIFSYDGSGRKIQESAEGRVCFYSYDPLGFLETTTFGDTSHVEIHDVEGTVIEKWDQKGPLRENFTRLIYGNKKLLVKAIRATSQGDVEDLFEYDADSRLAKHVDPKGAVTQFSCGTIQNDLGQSVTRKMTVNALGYRTIEITDASNRLASREKQDEYEKTLSFEEFFYDKAGNKSVRTYTVYLKDEMLKKITHLSEYDSMGRVIKEIEAEKKTTTYLYDEKGNLVEKSLPSGVFLQYSYDGLNRPLSLKSSDHTVHCQYVYGNGKDPIWAKDFISGVEISRTYNLFNQIENETSSQGSFNWEYDSFGRMSRFSLPDHSSITQEYLNGHLHKLVRKNQEGESLYFHTYEKRDPNGHIEEESFIHNLGRVYTGHDLLERPFHQTSPWNVQEISYDSLGRVDFIKNSLFEDKEISYDPLNQITKEGDKTYLFDSLGNSSLYEMNDFNEVVSSPQSKLVYDFDGNPKERTSQDKNTLYSYDALSRLTSITYPGQKKVLYFYDPFSRLFSKEVEIDSQREKSFFIYDQDKEIGLRNDRGQITQLKVLGLGLKGDVGGAIAIELDGEAFAPLHDFSGNCISLINHLGEIVETYKIDAFGKEISSPSVPKNPWRFSSKRHEEDLVFFGLRFYDLDLERWLTPDPSGFAEGPNLYLYALNSPLNRLDLFGLNSVAIQEPRPVIEVQLHSIKQAMNVKNLLIPAKFITSEVQIDWYTSCGHWHKMQFTPEELQVGKVDLLDHFSELVPRVGGQVGLLTLQNGILTPLKDLKEMSQSIIDRVPEGTLFFGMYNPTKNLPADVIRTGCERIGIMTKIVKATSLAMGAIAEAIEKINPQMIWLDTRHSEGGVIGRRAIENLTEDQKQIFKKQVSIVAVGPAKMIPDEYALEVGNLYSTKDYITGRWAKEINDGFHYSIETIICSSPWHQKTLFFADHGFMANTYQLGISNRIKNSRDRLGFFNANER